MTPTEIRGEISRFLQLLIDSGLAIAMNAVVVRRLEGPTLRVTWAPPATAAPAVITDTSFATVAQYFEWLQQAAFSAALFDGAFLQITYDVNGGDVVGHRLLYYPCPFDVDPLLLREEPLADVISMYAEHGDRSMLMKSPIRFDFDPDNQAYAHPASHATLNVDDCRCPVTTPLSLGHFIGFIFRQFYPWAWNAHRFLRDWPQTPALRTITRDEEAELHFAYRHRV